MTTARPSLGFVRDAVAVAVLAVLTVQALRRWVGDRYLVPSGSMEPTLHGDPVHGDIVFVDKLASAQRARGDLVVVAHPREPDQQLVKRIAAVGDDLAACWIDLKQGDVWLGDNPQRLWREVKEPRAARARRAIWARLPGPAAAADGLDVAAATVGEASGTWALAAAEDNEAAARRTFAADVVAARGTALPPGHIGTRGAVDAAFIEATGLRSDVGRDVPVTDCGVDLAIAGVRGDVLVTVQTCHEALTLHWRPADGRLVLWRNGVDVATLPFAAPYAGAPLRLEFGLLDDRVFCCIDDDAARTFTLARPDAWNGQGAERVLPPRTVLQLGVLGDASARLALRSLVVFRDTFVLRQNLTGPWPRHVEPGHWFLLGDSPYDSRDSRHFDGVPAASFLGVPRAVLGPWPRTRWVTP